MPLPSTARQTVVALLQLIRVIRFLIASADEDAHELVSFMRLQQMLPHAVAVAENGAGILSAADVDVHSRFVKMDECLHSGVLALRAWG